MKKYILLLAIFVGGIVVGGLFVRCSDHSRYVDVQRDTIVCYDTMRYSRLELDKRTYKLDVPKINTRELVYMHADSVTYIYRDSVRYVTYPREYFYTSTDDAEIWHSGIDSRIDSLNIVRKTTNVTNTYKAKEKKNSIHLGIEMSYLNTLSTPIYLEYERMLHKNVSFYGGVSYDLPTKQWGVGVGISLQIGW